MFRLETISGKSQNNHGVLMKNIFKISFLLIGILINFTCTIATENFAIAYTGAIQGEVDPCG